MTAGPGVLAGRAALVTGGATGLGAAVCVALARAGASVAVADLDLDAAQGVSDALGELGVGSLAVPVDVRRGADLAAAVERAMEAFGGLQVLVSNAGVQRWGDVVATTEDEWDLVVDTNLKGAYLAAKHAVPAIRASGGGAIVNTASVQALASQPGVAAYAASKGGLVAMTRTMALDHAADGIRVNCVAPGSVRTPLLHQAAVRAGTGDPDEVMAGWGSQHPLGVLAEPEDVAEAFVFLAGDASRYVTGTTLVVDGGLLARLGV